MTDSSTTYTAGGNTTYTITVSNVGPSAVTGAAVGDSFASGILFDNWTAVASTGASVATASGSGDITQIVNLEEGATVTFTVVAHFSAFATGNQYSAVSVGTTAITPTGVTDSNTANNSANVTLTPATPTPTPTATPFFTDEHRVYVGKGKHKKLIGFDLVFNGALDPNTAQNTSNYRVLAKQEVATSIGQIGDVQRRQFHHHAHDRRIQDHRGGRCLYRRGDRTQRLFRRRERGEAVSRPIRHAWLGAAHRAAAAGLFPSV